MTTTGGARRGGGSAAANGRARRGHLAVEPGIELVALRPLLLRPLEVVMPLRPGDRPVVTAGDSVAPGTVMGDQLRDTKLVEAAGDAGMRPGDRWTAETTSRRGGHAEGELLFESGGRWRIAAGDHHGPIEAPVAGIVRDVRPGQGIRLQAAGAGLAGVLVLGGTARGRLELAASADGEVRPRALDVGAAGAILVVGARIDAEALTRARAMGVRGIVVATLPSKDRRDFLASEARQRAALHRLPPFAVLVLHGSARRPIAEPLMALLEALSGHEVAIVPEPPSLVFDPDGIRLPDTPADAIHVRSGPLAGRMGRWAGLAGQRRFAAGTHLEAGFVRFGEDAPIALPLADLERYG